MANIELNKEFKPDPAFRTRYYLDFLLFSPLWLSAIVLMWLATMRVPPLVSILLSPLWAVLFLLFTLWWIPKFYDSVTYKITNMELRWKRGVWFKKTGIVPYAKITNVDVAQGPISRALGIASLKIQTAGYSVSSNGVPSSEIRIDGLTNFEEVQEMIMDFVRGSKVNKSEGESSEERMLRELVKIRKLLEPKKKSRKK